MVTTIRKFDIVDRCGYGSGPWDSEPDFYQWPWQNRFACMIRRSHVTGAWCGYAAVPVTHPLFGAPYDAVDEVLPCHGGLTYSGPSLPGSDRPYLEGEDAGKWWLFGFDCAHAGDLTPRYPIASSAKFSVVYRDEYYVTTEASRLMASLAKYENSLEPGLMERAYELAAEIIRRSQS